MSHPCVCACVCVGYTSAPGGPLFTPQFMGFISALAYLAMFIGILVYNKYFCKWSYRRAFTVTMLFLAAAGFVDLILVLRLNLQWGVSDKLMVIGESLSELSQSVPTTHSLSQSFHRVVCPSPALCCLCC